MANTQLELEQSKNFQKNDNIKRILIKNNVTIIFIVLTVAGIMLSDLSITYIFNELINRISRNLFLVLSLIIPIIAGVGLNFGIVVGAMAGQMAIIAITYWGFQGRPGFLLCILLATPIAILFGFLTGKLYNKTKGQEMIAGLILGFFANGLYQFLFLFLAGTLIPMKDHVMIKPDGIGLRNTIALNGDGISTKGIKYALDGDIGSIFFRWNFSIVLSILCIGVIVYCAYHLYQKQRSNLKKYWITLSLAGGVIVLSLLGSITNMGIITQIVTLKIPIVTWLVISLLCLFTVLLLKTKLGQDFRTIGQSQHIAKVAGIDVNRTRLIAVILSTVLAAWGQIIFLQNIGTMNTYGSHMQVGMFSVAAILIGGASVSKASIKHAILGVILFQSVFIVSPTAGKTLFGDAQIGEFFRAFVVYGVIGISLGLHTWKKRKLSQRSQKL